MGRTRQPNAVKIAKGTQKCRMNPPEPESPLGLGPAPDHLGERAAEAWDQLSDLAPKGVLTLADRVAAELIAQTCVELAECRRIVRVQGMTITEERGGGENSYSVTKAHPLLTTLLGLQKQLSDLLGKFGMTPSGRANLSVKPPEEKDPLMEFVRGRATPTGR
jgi:P27 family predicted phage terminase small subunit